MRVHYINIEQPDKEQKTSRATIAGKPILSVGQEWPLCRLCKAQMILFFQLDLLKAFELPLRSESHLLVFMCPVHNDVPTEMIDNERSLPAEYWQKSFGHYTLILNDPRDKEKTWPAEKMIAERTLSFERAEEQIAWDGRVECGSPGFKIGGVPSWTDELVHPICACGGEMVFVCQLPRDFGFPKKPRAPVQPAAVADDQYHLFLGRATCVFACKDQCSPYALYAVSQSRDELAESA